jgi:hypothetical protein
VEKKFRATLKGDRAKLYDSRGTPFFDGDNILLAKEWHWSEERKRYGETAYCSTYVRFSGDKKVKEWKGRLRLQVVTQRSRVPYRVATRGDRP